VQWNIFLFQEDEASGVTCIHYAVPICATMFVILELEQYIVLSLLSFVVVSSSTIHTAT
jgi:hypothetical protein